MIGILGGMGTQAGLDFCNKLAILNRGKIDQEYPLFLLYNKANIPGRPESMTVDRPAYIINPSKPGSDCAGESAASLASASILFQDTDPAYSSLLVQHAKELFSFADTYRGLYSNSIPDAAKFYRYSSTVAIFLKR